MITMMRNELGLDLMARLLGSVVALSCSSPPSFGDEVVVIVSFLPGTSLLPSLSSLSVFSILVEVVDISVPIEFRIESHIVLKKKKGDGC